MKQGRASHSGPGQQKVEPSARGINPAYVSRIGNHVGNHADTGSTGPNTVPMHTARGVHAPKAGQTNHHSGSQGKHR